MVVLSTLALLLYTWSAGVAARIEPTSIQVMVHGNADHQQRSVVFFEGFEALNPGIKIEILPSSSGYPQERLAVLTAGGIPPDVARLYGVAEVASAGLIQDITRRFETLSRFVRNDFWPVLIEGP